MNNVITIADGVKVIAQSEFTCRKDITSVIIPEGVTKIGDSAFLGCTSLTSISLPNSLTTIGYHTFSGCEALTSITIPDSVTEIGKSTFCGCNSLTHISVAKGNKKYDSRNDCNAIIETETNTLISGCATTIIPDSVTTIGDGAFELCTGLTSITIPNSVRKIDAYAFSATNLTSITIPHSVQVIETYTFSSCKELSSIIISEGVKKIEMHAFEWCSSLTSITIPNSVTKIGASVFEMCSGLKQVICENCTPPTMLDEGESLFGFTGKPIDVLLKVPQGSLQKYREANGWKEFQQISDVLTPIIS